MRVTGCVAQLNCAYALTTTMRSVLSASFTMSAKGKHSKV